ncbi:TonB-linked SusC/RagA family outer membrane protein [Dysgonomonadaceae bacterium PH5-43]|nr:TonB-linked SusC/RagA family outer membrane protein [Dysgonomonadaceae bacterium PH5-43]
MKEYNFKSAIKSHLSMQRILCFVVAIAMFLPGINASAQDKKGDLVVTGTVIDAATKNPLNGARVAIAETALSVLTDENGNYKIKVPTSSEVLLVSYPDYTLREVPVRGREVVNTQLYKNVFTDNYESLELTTGVEKRKTITLNAVNKIDDLDKSASITIDSDMQAKLGGDARMITRSGVSGIGAAMFIRGLNSLNANAQPLYIVDGIYWDNQLNTTSVHTGYFSNPLEALDINDIEEITLVKDGNSIYGSKGANGVVLIKTKRGRDMATRISADVTVGVNQKPSFPKMMNGSQYKAYASNLAQGWMTQRDYDLGKIESYFPFLDETVINVLDYQNDTDWSDEVYRDGMYSSIGLSVNGGDDVALYNLSMGYMQNQGTVDNTDMDRFNARFNADIKMFSKMYTSMGIGIARITRNMRDDGMDNKTAPGFISLVKAPILASHRYAANSTEFSPRLSNADAIDPATGKQISNPVALTENARGTADRTTFNLRVNPYYQFTDNIRFGTTFGYTMSRVKESFFIPKEGIAELVVDGIGYDNEVRDLSQRQNSVFSDTRLDWKFEFDGGHNLDLLGGFRYVSDSYNSMLPKGYNTGNDNVKVLISGLQNKSVSGTDEKWKSMSWYANATYDFKNKYILALTASADASSRFGAEATDGFDMFGQRWGLFPSVMGAWVISSEEFMKDVTFVDLLKLRASYTITGNDDIDPYASASYFNSVLYHDKAIGLGLGNTVNEQIQWETTKKFNVGLDMNLFNNRLALTVDAYKSTTDDLLTLKEIAEIAGCKYQWVNGGKLENKGLEFSTNVKVMNLRNFQWELGGSLGHYQNKLLTLPGKAYETNIIGDSSDAGTIMTQVGRPIGTFWGYKTEGNVFATAEEAASAYTDQDGNTRHMYNAKGEEYQAGDVRFVDLNGDGYINESDKMIIGDPNPDLYGNIFTKFKFKQFTLDALFTYSYGNDVYNYLRSQLESGSSFYNQTTAMQNRWVKPGDVTTMPRSQYGDAIGNNVFSDRWIEDGSYLRLKNITLSYDIPFRLSFLQGITVWGSVNNVWTWTKYTGSDPEFTMSNSALFQGVDNGLTPQGRSFHLGVKINL